MVTHFVYNGDDVYLEFVDNDSTAGANQPVLSQRYLHGPQVDQILAQEDGNGNVIWMLTDHLGTIRDLVDDSGDVVNHLIDDSFGRVIAETDPSVDTRYLFTGREFDEETGVYYYRARYYNAEIGRFIGEDPIGFSGGDANLYRYVENSPLSATDPTGNRIVTPPTAPPATPTKLPIPLWLIPPLFIPGGLLNPLPANQGEDEFLRQLNCPPEEQPQRKRCEFAGEFINPNPNVTTKICTYKCKGYGALATFPWPKDLPCPPSFDGNFPGP